MFILYDLIFIIFAIFYLPCFLLKKKANQGFSQRLGFLPDIKLNQPVWIHAVSVGEAKIAGVLIKQLRRVYPEKKFALSTVTATGNRIIREFSREGDFVFYLPLDLSFITKRVIQRIRPCVCIIIETEIWPNLITNLNKAAVPVVLVNARISDHSFFGYRIVKPLIKPILNKINFFCVQSNRDAKRLSRLGVLPDKLKITGNMKYDIFDPADAKRDYSDYRLSLGLKEPERLFVVGSTHPGEEEIILSVYKKLADEFPGLRLFIAPRHPERWPEIESLIRRFGFSVSRISQLKGEPGKRDIDKQAVFLLDAIGQLMFFYAVADIVFVGGSLIKKGGQNILEPAFFQKPIIFGPHMFNFRDITSLFLSNKAACMVRGQEGLLKGVRFLLNNHAELDAMSKRTRQLVLENQGATSRNVERLSLFISNR
ncbi:MAG: 3-deoxy-D-manno-octulosonic acid transferase [Candidatus Omnitrophota bacterium]